MNGVCVRGQGRWRHCIPLCQVARRLSDQGAICDCRWVHCAFLPVALNGMRILWGAAALTACIRDDVQIKEHWIQLIESNGD